MESEVSLPRSFKPLDLVFNEMNCAQGLDLHDRIRRNYGRKWTSEEGIAAVKQNFDFYSPYGTNRNVSIDCSQKKCKSRIAVIKFPDRLAKEIVAFFPVNWITYVLALNCSHSGSLLETNCKVN